MSALPPKLLATGVGAVGVATKKGAASAYLTIDAADFTSESAPAASSNTTSEPSSTLSPSLTSSSVNTPRRLAGIYMEALSDSTVIRLCSGLMVSLNLTSSSMTATSSKSPMSGTPNRCPRSGGALRQRGCGTCCRGRSDRSRRCPAPCACEPWIQIDVSAGHRSAIF